MSRSTLSKLKHCIVFARSISASSASAFGCIISINEDHKQFSVYIPNYPHNYYSNHDYVDACVKQQFIQIDNCDTINSDSNPFILYLIHQSSPPPSLSSTSSPPSSSPSSSSYTFNASAANNVAVYYGQTASTAAGGLLTLCQGPSVDIIILAFVYAFFGPNNYPSASFGPGCSGSTSSQAQSAPGLPSCPQLATEITQCQAIGKPVLLSLGGYIATTAFSSSAQAAQFASTIWNLFGGGGNDNSSSSNNSDVSDTTALRPFGSVIVDGFDIDNEDHSTAYYDDFSAALHLHIASDRSKKYYVSAAPQCPRPDASIPLGLMQAADFVWVQFYNNPQCNLGSAGFLDSFKAWSQDLAANASSGSPGPRLYIGGGAWSGAGSGYVEGSQLPGIVQGVNGSDVGNFGGMMFWDGTEGLANKDAEGKDYLDYAKEALG
ncbi:MAG: hypothetical protein Q9165_008615 [Trypethelium subeluteriae]